MKSSSFKRKMHSIFGSDDSDEESCSDINNDQPDVKEAKYLDENLESESWLMSIADMESSLVNRAYESYRSVLNVCKLNLAHCQCDICLNVIASCSTCVPCAFS